MRHEGMICSLLMGSAKEIDRQTATDGTSWTSCNCNCKASEGKLAMLSDSDASTVSDDGDWIHSDYSDDDEDEALRQLGVGVGPSRNGEFPPRVRLLRSKYLLMKRHYDHDRKVTAARARSWKIHPDPPCSAAGRKRKRNDTEMAATETSESESHDRNCNNDDLDEGSTTSKRPRQRLRSRHASCAPDFVQRVEGGLGGLPANTDRACEVAAPPILPVIPRHLSESALSVGCRRSQRIRKKLGSACGNSPIRRS